MPRFFCVVAVFVLASSLAADAEEATRPAADVFAGATVEKFKGRRITLVYDLSKPAALLDFDEVDPFLAEPAGGFTIEGGALRGKGVKALRHKGVFEADVAVTLTLKSETPRDIGVVLLEPGLTQQFLLFSLADNFYSRRDRQKLGQHMITVVGAEDSGPVGEIVFRYLTRARTPVLEAMKEIEVEVRKRGPRNRFGFAGKTLDASDKYGSFPEVQPGLFVLESSMVVEKLTISGRLTEEWLIEQRVEFDPNEQDDEAIPEADPPRDAAAAEPEPEEPRTPRRRRPESGSASDLVRRISNPRLTEKERKAAAAGLDRKNVKEDEMRALIQALYSDDVTTRTLTISVLKRVTGKTLGYHPKASEGARKKAVREWFQYLMRNREKFR